MSRYESAFFCSMKPSMVYGDEVQKFPQSFELIDDLHVYSKTVNLRENFIVLIPNSLPKCIRMEFYYNPLEGRI